MAGSFNSITLVGFVGRDPEMKYLPSGDPVTSFSLATSERRTGADGQQHDLTTWFTVSAFGKRAETCGHYLHKGSYVYVEGPLTQRAYTDRDGATRSSLDVRCRAMTLLDKRGESEEEPPAASTGTAGPVSTDVDDLPF